MPHGEYTAPDYYPRQLYLAEIQNPYTVFHSFFDSCSLPQAITDIDKWLKAVVKDGYWKKVSPASILHFHRILERLIEAAYLINKMNTQQSTGVLQEVSEGEVDLTNHAFYYKGQSSYSAWDYFPRSLSKKHFINPYVVFRKFFEYQDLPVWRDQLNDLFQGAFVRRAEIETAEYDLIIIQRHLKRIVEAAYLIDVRASKEVDQP